MPLLLTVTRDKLWGPESRGRGPVGALVSGGAGRSCTGSPSGHLWLQRVLPLGAMPPEEGGPLALSSAATGS